MTFLNHLDKHKNTENAYVNLLNHGDISSLQWIENTPMISNGRGNVFDVHFASLNFRDIMFAFGKKGDFALFILFTIIQ